MPVNSIKEKAHKISYINLTPLNFITIGRMSSEKEYPRLIKILKRLKENGYYFRWTIIGGGPELIHIQEMVNEADLKDEVLLTGALDNPFPRLVNADVFALLSSYEGLPNTIYESLILGVPVLATNVGGISSQIEDGTTGWLVENDENSIEDKLQYLLLNQGEVLQIKENLKQYDYDNSGILKNIADIFQRD